jgi:hypothetical protein
MGRRSRGRTPPAERAPQPRARASDRLSPARSTLAIYLGLAMFISVATVLGIAILGGTGGPSIVLAYALLGAGLSYRWARGRLGGLAMTDEDRMMQTMAGGLLAISVALAAISAIVVAVS